MPLTRCDECGYRYIVPRIDKHNGPRGECRRKAPVSADGDAEWPTIADLRNGMCGEGKVEDATD